MGVFIFGAAFASLFAKLAKPRRARKVRPPHPTPAPRFFYALVQTRPHVVVLAISAREDQLIREMNELDSTWNHGDLRTEGHRYEIQRVPVLVDVPAGVAAPGKVAANRR